MSSHRKLLIIPLVVLLASLVLILLFAKPAAPRQIDILAGPPGSSYYRDAEKIADFLADKRIAVNIVESLNSRQKLRRLTADDRPAAAFALAGVDRKLQETEDLEGLYSLGSLSFEPLWWFVAADSELGTVGELAGERVGVGPPDSDCRAIVMLALEENGVADAIVEPSASNAPAEARAEALIRGDLDAAFFLGSPDGAGISTLLRSRAVRVVTMSRAAAYERLFPEVAEVVVPRGLVDLAEDVPASELHLLAPADNLVVRDDLHPTVVDLLLDASHTIFREPNILAPRDTFPSMQHSSLPMSPAAIRYFEQGPSPLRKYLPYWLATLISRFGLIVAQVGAVALIVLKGPPMFLKIRFALQQQGIYRRMERLEKKSAAGADRRAVATELDAIDRLADDLKAPRMQISVYMELRQNIHDLRERLDLPRGTQPVAEEIVK